jgi:hypothetical protein
VDGGPELCGRAMGISTLICRQSTVSLDLDQSFGPRNLRMVVSIFKIQCARGLHISARLRIYLPAGEHLKTKDHQPVMNIPKS